MIGWRGSPKIIDEPQHKAKGKITQKLLRLLKIEFCILRKPEDLSKLTKLIKKAYKNKKIICCLIEKNTLKIGKFNKKKLKEKNKLQRKHFIVEFLRQAPKKSKIISTTGFTSRELMQLRNQKKLSNGKDFYMVGGMGHSSMVAMGYANESKNKVFCLDGDGSILMHLGSLRTVGYNGNKNFKHIILNNNSHESVGGQITTAEGIDFQKLSKSLGYKNYYKISNHNQLSQKIKYFIKSTGPSFLEVKIKNGSMKNLIRPKNLLKIKEQFMKK